MEFNKLVFGVLATGCLVAAGGGAYLAVRQNQAQPPASASAPAAPDAPTAPDAPAAPASTPVTESEGVITPAPPSAPETATPSATPRRAPVVTSRPADSRIAAVPARTSAPVAPTSAPEARRAPEAPSASGGSMWEPRAPVQPTAPEIVEEPVEPPAPPPPPAPEFVDLVVPPDAVLGLQIERTISSELARVEDKVEARVTRDVRVADRIAIPAGSTVRGSVTEVERGGRMKGAARLAVRFHTIVLADGTQLALKTDPVVREGKSPGGESAAKVGGAAIGGAILGAILGGGKGAAIGGAVGAAGGTAAAMTNDRNPATLPAGTTVTVRMQTPVTVTVQKE